MQRITFSLLGIFALTSALVCGEELKFSVAPGFFEENPDGKALGPCHGGVVIDKAGNIYVTTDTERGIVVFSPEGKYLKGVGLTKIHGLEIREENGTEYIYGARPQQHEAVKLTLDGKQQWVIGFPDGVGPYAGKE